VIEQTKMKNLLLILTTILTLCSCGSDSGNAPIEESKYCENQLRLISAYDSIPHINIDFNKDGEALMQGIEKVIGRQVCDAPVYFSINYDLDKGTQAESPNSIPLKLFVSDFCESDPPRRLTF
jgi:hypothetical protein